MDSDDEQKIGAFSRWLLRKEERFYVLFLVSVFTFFVVTSLFNMALIGGVVVAGLWIVFYYTVIKK